MSKADDEGASGREDEATSAGTGGFIAGTVAKSRQKREKGQFQVNDKKNLATQALDMGSQVLQISSSEAL